MNYILIDDIREFGWENIPEPDGIEDAWVTCRTFDHGIEQLSNTIGGPWDVLFLDHDLGDLDPAKTGYGIMCFLEANPQFLPKKIILVTANPVGRIKMQTVIKRLYQE